MFYSGKQVESQGLIILMGMRKFAANIVFIDYSHHHLSHDDRRMGIVKGESDFKFMIFFNAVSSYRFKTYPPMDTSFTIIIPTSLFRELFK